MYNDGSKIKGLPQTHQPLLKHPGHVERVSGELAYGLWNGVTGDEDGDSMQEGHMQPGSDPHTVALLPAPASYVGMGKRCTDGVGGAQPSPKIVIL